MLLRQIVTFSLALMMGCSGASPAFANVDHSVLDSALEYLNSPGLVGRDLALVGTPTFAAGVVLLFKPLLKVQDYEAYLAKNPAEYRWGSALTIGGSVLMLLGTGFLLYRAHQLLHGPTPTDPEERAKVEMLRDFFMMPFERQRHVARGDEAIANFVIDYAEYLRLTLPPPRTLH